MQLTSCVFAKHHKIFIYFSDNLVIFYTSQSLHNFFLQKSGKAYSQIRKNIESLKKLPK